MNTLEFLTSLRKSDITITVNGEGLQIDAPPGVITESLKSELKNRKKEILYFLQKTNNPVENEEDHITPISHDLNIPLSPSQARLWSLAQLMPHDPSYNMHMAFNIEGTLHVQVLKQSVQKIIARHESLRTTFSIVDGDPIQIIAPKVILPLSLDDLSKIDEKTQGPEIERLINVETRTPFDLIRGPLLRVKLLKVHNHKHVIVLTMHHLISDGWSFFTFFKELTMFYEATVHHEKPLLPTLQLQYADFSVWHREWLNSEQYRIHVNYWRTDLGNHVASLVLPLDQPRPNKLTTDAASQTLTLPSPVLKELNAFGTHQGVSHNIIFLTAFLVVLFKYSGQEDIIICSPVSGRTRDELRPLIGFFNNIVPIRVILNKDLSISEILKKVRIKTLDVLEHQDVPLHHIISESHVDRVPLTRAMFDFQNYKTQSFRLPGTTINTLDIHNGTTNFELTLTVFEKEEEFQCTMEYKTSLFTNKTIERMLAYFETVLAHTTRTPEQKLSAIPSAITTLQQEKYLQFNECKQKSEFNTKIKSLTPSNFTDSSSNTQDGKPQEEVEHRLVSQLPQNSLEAKMTKIWEELLENGPIGRNENFFDLGGHSLLAVSLFSRIQTVFGEHLPLSTILHASTIEQLTKVLAKRKQLNLWDSLVPIQIRGSKPPIFAVHPISGNILTYAELSRILGPDQPFYGLQSLGLDGKTKPFKRIEDMAAHYIREIEEVQPQGPYFLVGVCMGGLVAFEMAQQFHAKGKHVAFLGLMETWLPSSNPGSGTFNPKKFPNLGLLWDGSERYYKQLREIGVRNWIPHTLNMIQVFFDMVRRFDIHRGDQEHKRTALVLAANLRASETYNPKPYGDKITYCLASARRNIGMPDPRLEWEAFAKKGFEIFRIPAPNSGDLLARPYVLELGVHLKEALQRVKKERT